MGESRGSRSMPPLRRSLFERLARNGVMPLTTLASQRRMHKSLTPLHSWIYPSITIADEVGERKVVTRGHGATESPSLGPALLSARQEDAQATHRCRQSLSPG